MNDFWAKFMLFLILMQLGFLVVNVDKSKYLLQQNNFYLRQLIEIESAK